MMHSPAGTVRQLAGTTDQVEVFCLPDHYPEFEGETGERPPHGWYWWCVVDGGHPDSYMVGPFGKGSQLRHLVIYGHNIQNRKGGPVLGRTRPNNFVQRGEEKARSQSFDAIASAAKGMIEELGKP